MLINSKLKKIPALKIVLNLNQIGSSNSDARNGDFFLKSQKTLKIAKYLKISRRDSFDINISGIFIKR